jgi:hypothetical protein
MCRNIRVLYNFDPPATQKEIDGASLQFVRKISGYHQPSRANAVAFDQAVVEVAAATRRLLESLVTDAPSRDREIEHQKAHARALKRFGPA